MPAKIISLIKKPAFLASLFATFMLIASYAPIPYRYLISPKNQIYNGTEFWSDDYSAYVSYIIQGQQGKWLAYDTHTAEPGLPGILIHTEYVLWGKLTGIFGISPAISYHLFRFTLSFILMIVLWKFITRVLDKPQSQLAAYFIILFVGGFPHLQPGKPPESFIPWMTELDIFYRFSALPHYLLGNIVSILTLSKFLDIQRFKNQSNLRSLLLVHKSDFILLLFFGFITGFTHAVSLIYLYLTMGIYTLIKNSINLTLHLNFKKALHDTFLDGLLLLAFVTVTAPILIYFKYLLTFQPWQNLSAAWEASTQYYIPPREVALAIGPVLFLAPLGLLLLLTKKTNKANSPAWTSTLILFSWPITFFLLFYYSYPIFHISQVRFFQSYFFIPLGILSAVVITELASILSNSVQALLKLKLKSSLLLSPWKIRLNEFFMGTVYKYFFVFLLLLLLLLPTISLSEHSFFSRFTFYSDFNYLIYPPADWANAIYWLRDHTSHNSVVLGAWQAGHHIPFMAGNYVYYGHMWGTLDLAQKQTNAGLFFSSHITSQEAEVFLKSNRIDYVFWGYEERSYGGNPLTYKDIITPVYQTASVAIFKVN